MAEYRHYRPGASASSMKFIIAHILLLGISFAFTNIVINQLISSRHWNPDKGEVDAKLAAFNSSDKAQNLLIFGSSHIDYGLNPLVLDETLAANNVKSKSFNLACEGMTVSERRFLLSRALELSAVKPCYVLVEFELRATPLVSNLTASRTRYFSSLKYAPAAFNTKFYSERPFKQRVLPSGVIAIAAVLNQLNLGVLADIAFPNVNLNSSDKLRTCADFSSVGWKDGKSRYGNRNLPLISKHIKIANSSTSSPRRLTESEYFTIANDLRLITQAGCIPVVVFPPSCSGIDEDHSIRNAILTKNPEVIILDFTVGSEGWPSFTSSDMWFDTSHLSADGATVFSELVGSRLSSIIPQAITGPE